MTATADADREATSSTPSLEPAGHRPATTAPTPADEAPLGPLARLIAVPLAPFVALWEGGRALVTQVVPAALRGVGALAAVLGRLLLAPVRAVGGLLAGAWRAVMRPVRWLAVGVRGCSGGWPSSVGRWCGRS